MLAKLKTCLTETTRRAYLRAWSRFSKFARHTLRVALNEVSNYHIALYITHLDSLHLRTSTIRSHISAIAFVFKINDLHDPTDGFLTSKLFAALTKTQRPRRKLSPITSSILRTLINVVPFIFDSAFDRSLFRALFAIMYHGCMRASECTKSTTTKHTLRAKQVCLRGPTGNPRSLVIKFKSYKHAKGTIPKLRIKHRHYTPHCPVALYANYLRHAPPLRTYAFCHQNGSPVGRAELANALLACVACANLRGDFNTHSFRIGCATDLFLQGNTEARIKAIGRWKSNAFREYIRPAYINA